MRLTREQLQNDLDAAKYRENGWQASIDRLERRARDAETALHAALVDRDDWRSAFKLIMRLVK